MVFHRVRRDVPVARRALGLAGLQRQRHRLGGDARVERAIDDGGKRACRLRRAEQRAQRRVREQQLAGRPEDPDGVGQVLDDRVEPGLRPFGHSALGEQPITDRLNLPTEIAELVLRQIQRRRLAALQFPQAAAQHVNRTQQPLRQQHRADDRADQHPRRRDEHRLEPLLEVNADEQRRDADADGAEVAIAQLQGRHDLVGPAVLAEDPPQLLEPGEAGQLVEPGRGRLPAADPIRIEVRDDGAVGRDDGGVGDLRRVDRRLEDGAQPAVAGERRVGVWRGLDDLERPLVDGVGQQVRAVARLFEPDRGQLRQSMHAEADDHGGDERRDAEDLFRADRKAHRPVTGYRLRVTSCHESYS